MERAELPVQRKSTLKALGVMCRAFIVDAYVEIFNQWFAKLCISIAAILQQEER